jgi:hypothetical protein
MKHKLLEEVMVKRHSKVNNRLYNDIVMPFYFGR